MSERRQVRAHRAARATCRASVVAVVLLGAAAFASPVASSAVPTNSVGATWSVAHVVRARVGASTVARSHAYRGAANAPSAQKYEGLSICTDATGLRVSRGRTEMVSGIAYMTIIFVNAGTSNCYLNGTPHTQPVGAAYTPVGPPSAAYFDASRTGYVVLDAGGGAASTSLGIGNAGKYYPRSSCVPKKMIGVTLRFSYPADFFFRLGAGPIAVCEKITTTSITGVARGVIEGP